MVHGESNYTDDFSERKEYYRNVIEDIRELKKYYPFTTYVSPPTIKPSPIRIRTIAADYRLISITGATEQDFLGEYSKELEIIVPFDYKVTGCKVYAGKWIDKGKIKECDQHFYDKNEHGNYLLCVGIPESFSRIQNVILENVRTADKMLVAYELYQSGQTKSLKLIAYSHGNKGRYEYKKETEKNR